MLTDLTDPSVRPVLVGVKNRPALALAGTVVRHLGLRGVGTTDRRGLGDNELTFSKRDCSGGGDLRGHGCREMAGEGNEIGSLSV
jgi:hypothetical protein